MIVRMPQDVDDLETVHRVKPVVIEINQGESCLMIALAIAQLAIKDASVSGMGAIFAKEAEDGPLVGDDDVSEMARQLIEQHEISIEYFKGRMVKLRLSESDGCKLVLSAAYWADRWCAPDDPRPILEEIQKVLEQVPAEVKNLRLPAWCINSDPFVSMAKDKKVVVAEDAILPYSYYEIAVVMEEPIPPESEKFKPFDLLMQELSKGSDDQIDLHMQALPDNAQIRQFITAMITEQVCSYAKERGVDFSASIKSPTTNPQLHLTFSRKNYILQTTCNLKRRIMTVKSGKYGFDRHEEALKSFRELRERIFDFIGYASPDYLDWSWHDYGPFQAIKDATWEVRISRGEQFLDKLEGGKDIKAKLEATGVEYSAWINHSRKQPSIHFNLRKEGCRYSIDCDIANKELRAGDKASVRLENPYQLMEAILAGIEAVCRTPLD